MIFILCISVLWELLDALPVLRSPEPEPSIPSPKCWKCEVSQLFELTVNTRILNDKIYAGASIIVLDS